MSLVYSANLNNNLISKDFASDAATDTVYAPIVRSNSATTILVPSFTMLDKSEEKLNLISKSPSDMLLEDST